MHVFTVRLADADRAVYETLALRVAQHPSETPQFLVARVLAYCLEYAEGITFSKGLSDPEEPAILVHDLTGALQTWIEVGMPEAARLHKASKAARTEAAAVTGVGVSLTALRPQSEPFKMVVNRPFPYFIEDRRTETILFMGVVFDPTAG